jgi:hypothetical protein
MDFDENNEEFEGKITKNLHYKGKTQGILYWGKVTKITIMYRFNA